MKPGTSDGMLDLEVPLKPEVFKTLKNDVKPSKEPFPESYLHSVVPSGDRGEIGDAMRKGFILAKRKNKKKVVHHVGKKRALNSRQLRALNTKLFYGTKFVYAELAQFHQLWIQYASDFLDIERIGSLLKGGTFVFDPSDANYANMLSKMSKLDLHGSELVVECARCPTNVGISGIVIQETRFALRLVTKQNRVKLLLKDGSVFDFVLGDIRFSVIGSSILTRPIDRASKKIKITQPVFQFALK